MVYKVFFCFILNILKDFRVITAASENNRLIAVSLIPSGIPTTPENFVIEISRVITAEVLKSLFIASVIVLNHFIFFANFS